MSLSKILTVVVGAGLSLSAAALFLLLYIRQREENEFESQLSNVYRQTTKSANQATIRMKVPKNTLGAIIGRQGANIKEIQETTKTKINFPNKDAEENECIALIRGHPDDVHEAEIMILKTIQEQMAIEISEMYIPSDACGRIIGRNGENIRFMCRVSKAKINVENQNRTENRLQKITIKGTPDQIEYVKALINEKVEEFQREVQKSTIQKPSKDKRMLCIASPDDTQPYRPDLIQIEELKSTANDGFMEVYVSSLNSPSQFWVQLVQGGRSIELDKLIAEMTEYYSNPANREAHVIEEVKVGDIVAAPFRLDNAWYRARVQHVEEVEESYNAQERKLSLHYVDFGDVESWALNEVYALDKACLYLPLQAVECSLGGIIPVGGVWSDEAIQMFANLTHMAHWKAILLKVLGETESSESPETRVKIVELIDSTGDTDINVAEELVKSSYAVLTEQTATADSNSEPTDKETEVTQS